jgi:hypothetical protein
MLCVTLYFAQSEPTFHLRMTRRALEIEFIVIWLSENSRLVPLIFPHYPTAALELYSLWLRITANGCMDFGTADEGFT